VILILDSKHNKKLMLDLILLFAQLHFAKMSLVFPFQAAPAPPLTSEAMVSVLRNKIFEMLDSLDQPIRIVAAAVQVRVGFFFFFRYVVS
jgi:hypothetical protein